MLKKRGFIMTLRAKDCIGKWVKFTQMDGDCVCGYVDRALVVSPCQVYLNTEDNPRCRPDTGYTGGDSYDVPDWADYGWYMGGAGCYKDLQLIEDMGEW
jgi:hypothetical protein